MQQQLRALDVTQKTIAQARAGVSTFNQSGYIGDHEGTKVTETNHPEMRLQRCKRVIRNLRVRGRNSRNERRLSGVRKTHETDVGQQLQLELKVQLFSLPSVLMVAGSAIRRGREVRVAETAAATTCGQPAIAVVTQVVQ